MLLRRHKKKVSELQQVEVKPVGNSEKVKKSKKDELLESDNTSSDNSKKAGKIKVKK